MTIEAPNSGAPVPAAAAVPDESGSVAASGSGGEVATSPVAVDGLDPGPTTGASVPATTRKPQPAEPEALAGARETASAVLDGAAALFRNPYVQGALAIGCAIPGLGNVVSGLAAIWGGLSFLSSCLKGQPDWTLLALSAGYGIAAFLPGPMSAVLGATTGVGGMMAVDMFPPPPPPPQAPPEPTDSESENPESGGVENSTDARAAEASDGEPSPAADPEQLEAAIDRTLALDTSELEAWNNDVMTLRREQARLAALESPSEADRAQLETLNSYLDTELPDRFTTAMAAAAGMPATPELVDSVRPGTFFSGERSENFVADAAGELDVDPDQLEPLLDAIGVSEGGPVYIPSAEQVSAFHERRFPEGMDGQKIGRFVDMAPAVYRSGDG